MFILQYLAWGATDMIFKKQILANIFFIFPTNNKFPSSRGDCRCVYQYLQLTATLKKQHSKQTRI